MNEYHINVTYKAIKHIYLRVKPPGILEITCPKRTTHKQIQQMIDDKKTWIDRHMLAVREHNEKQQESYNHIFLAGNSYPIIISQATKNYAVENEGTIYLFLKDATNENRKDILLKQIYHDLMFDVASVILDNCYERHHTILGRKPNLKIRFMESRWGSLSKKTNTLALAARLGAYPTYVIESVILHELAHTVHMNHQSGFYHVLYKMMPNYAEHRKMLKQYRPTGLKEK